MRFEKKHWVDEHWSITILLFAAFSGIPSYPLLHMMAIIINCNIRWDVKSVLVIILAWLVVIVGLNAKQKRKQIGKNSPSSSSTGTHMNDIN